MHTGSGTRAACAAILAFAFSVELAAAQEQRADHPGKAVYEQFCAACHNQAPGNVLLAFRPKGK